MVVVVLLLNEHLAYPFACYFFGYLFAAHLATRLTLFISVP